MKFFRALTFCSSIFLVGCVSSLKDRVEPNKEFRVNAYWAQDTLAKANHAFRKVNRMTPVIHENLIIIGNAYDGLVAYDKETKYEKWRIPIDLGVEASAISVSDFLFIGSNNGKMYSIDLSKGVEVWAFDTKSEIVAEPLLQDGILYFVSGSQSLYALDASTGKQLWVHNRQETSNIMTVRGGSKPAFKDGLIYAGFSDGTLVALNAKTGTEQWEVSLNRNTRFRDIDASPVFDGDFIYINSYDDHLYCIAKSDGQIIWESPIGGFSTPLVTSEVVYVTSSRGEIAALDKKSGQEKWKYSSKNGILTDPLAYEDLIVTGESRGKLLFLQKDSGAIVNSFEPGRGVFSKPSLEGDRFYFISGEGNIYGLKAYYDTKSSIYYLK
ncbi:PQQ-binding-like beta-propeller repeat protein [Pseudobdellovibrio exovorus]|uniref:Putative lipoprotein n=1 Tax=Pseudobdellovibrio exovorus JSS TaxID=1184267 RepID=M4VQV3_9BACT|nr:PQQ-binding-like beta-propeller repeat protein [Pseudobdellovibrio exovorus]AGH95529.1 putative lipoprotein [Pseudobdellovibrio exovorus JSS]